MARKERKKASGPSQGWLVTFGDMITLLLTFFVLLLSMASMDQSFLTRVSVFSKDIGFLTARGAGKVPSRVLMVIHLMERPQDILLNKDRIKDLLFPDEVLPPEIDRKTLDENLEILQRPEGLALVLSDKLLFGTGSSQLSSAAEIILSQIVYLLGQLNAPVNVSGHSDNAGGESDQNFMLSAERAMSVLRFMLGQRLDPMLFSVSAYGPNMPLDATTPRDGAKNRRVEILVKTQLPLGSYS